MADLFARPDAPASSPIDEPLYGAAADRIRDQLREHRNLTPGVLPVPVRDLFAAIAEALDIPLPSTDDTDERTYRTLLARRTSEVRIHISTMLDYPDVDISRDAIELRARIALMPVTYGLYEPVPAERGEEQ